MAEGRTLRMPRTTTEHGGRWLFRSLASRVALVCVVFVAVPILVYQQFRAADQEKQMLLLQSAQQNGQLIARALQPLLEQADNTLLPELGRQLGRFADEHTRLKLLLRPTGVPGAQGFFYVGAAPSTPNANLDLERQQLLEQGILGRLAETCSGNQPLAIRLETASGGLELLTSITPINTQFGCWAIVTSHSTRAYLGSSLGRPYWRTPEVQAAALIYLAMAVLVLLLFLGVWRNLNRFGALARQIGSQEAISGSFAMQNTVPELASVAEDFDRLVETLRNSAETLRRAAEDNAHAFKTPIAVIRQSVEPLKRSVTVDDNRAKRAIDMIERSVDRLDGLVSFARSMDETTADLLAPPRRKVDLSALLERMLAGYSSLLSERRLHLKPAIDHNVIVRASDELLETVVENIVENAISFSPLDGAIRIRLSRSAGGAELVVEDDGPGVEPFNIERIFERYFSQRPAEVSVNGVGGNGDAPHFGIGLWIVRRNVEAVGGRVYAENRPSGGLCLRVSLPLVQ